jgi:DNA-directed RNA polymerase specialized sigma24 family protein
VAKKVMAQSINSLRWWENEAEVANWFLHHTVLTTREYCDQTPDATDDCLITTLSNPSPEYIAFVKALRLLPSQQREAFLLFRGEHLDMRQAAVAMDCSTGAVTNHQIAANKAMSEIAGATFDARTAELMRVYATLTPREDLIVGDVGAVARKLRRGKMRHAIRQIVLLAILAAVGWTIWRLSKMISI